MFSIGHHGFLQEPWVNWNAVGGFAPLADCDFTLYTNDIMSHTELFVAGTPVTGDITNDALELIGNRSVVTGIFTPNIALDPEWYLVVDKWQTPAACITVQPDGDFAFPAFNGLDFNV